MNTKVITSIPVYSILLYLLNSVVTAQTSSMPPSLLSVYIHKLNNFVFLKADYTKLNWDKNRFKCGKYMRLVLFVVISFDSCVHESNKTFK